MTSQIHNTVIVSKSTQLHIHMHPLIFTRTLDSFVMMWKMHKRKLGCKLKTVTEEKLKVMRHHHPMNKETLCCCALHRKGKGK